MTKDQQQQAIDSYNQGVLHENQGKRDDAIRFYQQAIAIKSDFAEAYNNLGNLLMQLGQLEKALYYFQKTIELKPNSAHAHNNIGNIFVELGRLEEAQDNLRTAIALDPNQQQPYLNLARTFIKSGGLEQAITIIEKALQINPDNTEAHLMLSHILLSQGQVKGCVTLLQQLYDRKPNDMLVASTLLFIMHYLPDYSSEDLSLATAKCAACFNLNEGHFPPYSNRPDAGRRLRIGYVSGDFGNHPVGYFIEPVIAQHDRKSYEIYCYYNNDKCDPLTEHLQNSADWWRNINGLSDNAVVRQIREDGIDILIDLSGHTGENRLAVFSQKPAPVQATWLGYFNTTGVNAMDYIIADRYIITPEEEPRYTEQVVRLPNAYLCFSPPDFALDPGPLPASTSQNITFGCFNNPAKLTEAVIACWSKLLRALPQANLFLKYKWFRYDETREHYKTLFTRQGIDINRIRFAAKSPRNDFLAAYHDVDIALDPYPYNGGTTTLEALWMGVPVVTLCGDHFVSRVGATIMTNVGLAQCVADSEEAYIEAALALAADLRRLAALRSGLRDRLLNSPLCDGLGFTRDLETAYRRMWESWCMTQA